MIKVKQSVFIQRLSETFSVNHQSAVRLAGVQSAGTAGEAQGHDQRGLHGTSQSLVLLHRARESHLWSEPNLGFQPDEEKGHRHTSARHSQVNIRT